MLVSFLPFSFPQFSSTVWDEINLLLGKRLGVILERRANLRLARLAYTPMDQNKPAARKTLGIYGHSHAARKHVVSEGTTTPNLPETDSGRNPC